MCLGSDRLIHRLEPPSNAAVLSLDATSLTVGDVACTSGPACRVAAFIVRLIALITELFVGAVIVVRLSRVISKRRFIFAKNVIVKQGELKIRLCSNRPSKIMMPSFRLEWFDTKHKFHPLDLDSGGATAYIMDSTLTIRHLIDDASPFANPQWRNNVLGIRVAIMGYDDLLCEDVSGCRFYRASDIRDDGTDFRRMAFAGMIRSKKVIQPTVITDFSLLDDLVEGDDSRV